MNKQRAQLQAQREANRTGENYAVLNLNTVGAALYVVRAYHETMGQGPHAHQLVTIHYPSTIEQGG